jgi:histidine triad (HIT) family protein
MFRHHVSRLPVWVAPCHPGTPREYWGSRVDEWSDVPRGGPPEMADLCERIRVHLTTEG